MDLHSSFRKQVVIPAATAVLLSLPGLCPTAAQTPEGPQFQVNTFTTTAQFSPVVAAEGSDGFVVAWESFLAPGSDDLWGVVARRFANGLPTGDDFQVNAYTSDIQVEPAVGSDGDGGFVVSWRSYGSFGTDHSFSSIQARHFPSTGLPGGEFQVNTYTTGEQLYPAVAPRDGGFVVIWASRQSSDGDNDWSIRARLYDDDGTPTGDEYRVNSYTTGTQIFPSVAPTSDGGFVVVWETEGLPGEKDDEIRAQQFDADGAPLGAEFQVNAFTTSSQEKPDVAALDDGFVVVWTSDGSDGTDGDDLSIQGLQFSANRSPVGGQFQVNTYTTNRQSYPVVDADGDGGFLVVWRSEGSSSTDNDDASIQAQRYSRHGSAIGDEFQVNSYTTARQSHPGVALDGTGGFVIAWSSDGTFGNDTDPSSIEAQRYAVAIFADGFESGDTSGWSQTVP